MKLPNAESAFVPREKLINYLLSETHPVGRFKSAFFRGMGFDETTVKVLERGLLTIAKANEITSSESTSHGSKYVVDGSLESPIGRTVSVRTVWIIDLGDDRPRFVTAYPN